MKIYLLKKEKGKKYESKQICEKVLGFSLEYDEKGKPLGCSISDTKNYWVCAIGSCGIDIEETSRRPKESIVRALHAQEQEYLQGLSYGTSEWNTEFLRIWTGKEAYFKLTGQGYKHFSVFDENMNYRPEFKLFTYKNVLGTIVTDEEIELETIKFAGVSAKPCMEYAADLLAIKSYSSLDLFKKLKTKGYTDEESKETVEKLKELSYLDDADYAERFAEKMAAQGKGSAYIRQKLALSGISKDLIPEIEGEYERALQLASSMQGKNPEQIARRLASLGYPSSVVYKVLERIR